MVPVSAIALGQESSFVVLGLLVGGPSSGLIFSLTTLILFSTINKLGFPPFHSSLPPLLVRGLGRQMALSPARRMILLQPPHML